MAINYPTPQDLGMVIPPHLRHDRFCQGFTHGLKGGQLDQVEYFRLSFRLGYRASKLYLRQVRRRHGVLEFPLRGRVRLRAI
jgi:hypothetical protein